MQDDRVLDRAIRAVAGVCDGLGIVLDGGVTYMAATEQFAERLGGAWLHYGGQRGRNDLAEARALAIIASPTAPPDAITRKAMALWCDDAPIGTEWVKGSAVADYRATDPRLDSMNQLHGAEELRQSAHRCRPILSTTPTKLLIFSPWPLAELGLTPTAPTTIDEMPYSGTVSGLEDGFILVKLDQRSRTLGGVTVIDFSSTEALIASVFHADEIRRVITPAA